MDVLKAPRWRWEDWSVSDRVRVLLQGTTAVINLFIRGGLSDSIGLLSKMFLICVAALLVYVISFF